MRADRYYIAALVGFTLIMLQASGVQAMPVDTAFMYQGRLLDEGAPADGAYDFQFMLFDDSTGGSRVGGAVNVLSWPVMDGLFSVPVDFGEGVFTRHGLFLEIAVRPGGSGDPYETLAPRQPLKPAPWALALPGLWTEQRSDSPNIIGGYDGNNVTYGVFGGVIGGGGADSITNRITDHFGTIGGGAHNQAGDGDATLDDSHYSTVGGGWGNAARALNATVSGGYSNIVDGDLGNIGGGSSNMVNGPLGTVGGGHENTANGSIATVAGGDSNSASGNRAAVVGGQGNVASGDFSLVGAGYQNTASGGHSAVGGGQENSAESGYCTVGGGYQNTASGHAATVPGGLLAVASGDYSLAAGNRAKANHDGAFVWADHTMEDFASTAPDQFLIRATGGVGIGTASPTSPLHAVDDSPFSDRPAISGHHTVTDYYGIGVEGLGGYVGVRGRVTPTGSSSYFGVHGVVDGGTGTNYAVRGDASGSGPSFQRNVYGGYFTSSGERESSAVCGANTSHNVEGHLGYVSAGAEFPTIAGVYGYGGGPSPVYWAGYFSGKVQVTGTLSKGAGSFKIDHPLDPENKYLYHSFVESPDMMNIYNGNVVLDAEGTAVVAMPAWFEALNMEFRYQLTAVGAPAPNLHIAQEIDSNEFAIAGGEPGAKVSWQVTGIRQDPYARANRIPIEVEKRGAERGTYLHAKAWGKPVELQFDSLMRSTPKARTTSGKTESMMEANGE